MVAHHVSNPASTRTDRTRVAGTARFIARNLFVTSSDARYAALLPAGCRDLYWRLLTEAGDRWFVRAASNRFFRAVFQRTVNAVLPGIVLHYIARKRCVEQWLRQIYHNDDPAAGGCRQVVVLGAGLDTLAWRLHEGRPELSFIELDRPGALSIKARAMAAGSSLRQNLEFLPADLGAETLAEALERSRLFDPSISTLFLAEGLLMYLPPERVRSLFYEIKALETQDHPHFFAFTFMEARSDGRIGFRRSNWLVDWWLRWQGEPFRWSQAPETLHDFVAQEGFALRELESGETLRTRYLESAGLRDAPLAMGEWFALAQTSARS